MSVRTHRHKRGDGRHVETPPDRKVLKKSLVWCGSWTNNHVAPRVAPSAVRGNLLVAKLSSRIKAERRCFAFEARSVLSNRLAHDPNLREKRAEFG